MLSLNQPINSLYTGWNGLRTAGKPFSQQPRETPPGGGWKSAPRLDGRGLALKASSPPLHFYPRDKQPVFLNTFVANSKRQQSSHAC